MIHVRTINAILGKQIKDIWKNAQVLILFFMFPLIALVMTKSMGDMGQGELFFISIFGIMHGIFTPLLTTASLISEEKEQNTLRVLLMSRVSPVEYLVSTGGFVLICTVVSGGIFLVAGELNVSQSFKFMSVLCLAAFISIILGMCIGGQAKNMMAANGMAVPLGMVFAFLPMLASFNDKIERFSKLTYGGQLKGIMEGSGELSMGGVTVIVCNLLVIIIAFVLVFRRNKLED